VDSYGAGILSLLTFLSLDKEISLCRGKFVGFTNWTWSMGTAGFSCLMLSGGSNLLRQVASFGQTSVANGLGELRSVSKTDAGLSYDEIVFGETFVSKLGLTSIGIRPANGNSCERDSQMASSTLDWPIGITRKRKRDAEKCCSTCPHA
jgi:hypothetical protein